jgi:hypothetical protein
LKLPPSSNTGHLLLPPFRRCRGQSPSGVSRGPRFAFFFSSTSTTSQPLNLVHMDTIGPIRQQGFDGSQYAVTVHDEYSSYCAVLCVAGKYQGPDRVIELLTFWERQTGHLVMYTVMYNSVAGLTARVQILVPPSATSRRLYELLGRVSLGFLVVSPFRIACVFLHVERGRSSKRVWRSPRKFYLHSF